MNCHYCNHREASPSQCPQCGKKYIYYVGEGTEQLEEMLRKLFPALRVAREALIRGGRCPTVLNAANETAVHAFLDGRIGFLDIVETVERTLEAIPEGELESLDDVYNFDTTAREIATGLSGLRNSVRGTA